MPAAKTHYTTGEACEVLQVYGTKLWSYIGRGLSAPLRLGPKTVLWLADEVDRLAAEVAEAKQRLK